MDSAEKQARYRARQKAREAAEQGLPFPGPVAPEVGWFTDENREMTKVYAETIWALHAAKPQHDLSPDPKQNVKKAA